MIHGVFFFVKMSTGSENMSATGWSKSLRDLSRRRHCNHCNHCRISCRCQLVGPRFTRAHSASHPIPKHSCFRLLQGGTRWRLAIGRILPSMRKHLISNPSLAFVFRAAHHRAIESLVGDAAEGEGGSVSVLGTQPRLRYATAIRNEYTSENR